MASRRRAAANRATGSNKNPIAGIEARPASFAYAVPYFTRAGSDTEYLLSNPGPTTVNVVLGVFRKCQLVKKLAVRLGPNCTRSLRVRPIAPDTAGHTTAVATAPIVITIMYYRADDVALTGSAQAGKDNLVLRPALERSRTYGFGYRALAVGHDSLGGSVFVSNPFAAGMSGEITFFDQHCEKVSATRFRISPGCTQEFPFPAGRFGYGRITVSSQAAVNVLHFAASSRGLATAELLGEADRISSPPAAPRSKILFDDTHGCRPGVTGDWVQYEQALVAAGYTVAHHTRATVTLSTLKQHDVFVVAMARSAYAAAEKQAMVDYVNGGGGMLIVQDFGNAPWSLPTRELLNLFGASDDNNIMDDALHCFTPGQSDDVVFDYNRNFLPHPIVSGWKSFHVDAAASLSGAGWTTVVETDDDAMPARRPAVLAREFGAGRVVTFGDSNTWADHLIGHLENKLFGVRCAEWLLFRI
jgi:hypothetical protein